MLNLLDLAIDWQPAELHTHELLGLSQLVLQWQSVRCLITLSVTQGIFNHLSQLPKLKMLTIVQLPQLLMLPTLNVRPQFECLLTLVPGPMSVFTMTAILQDSLLQVLNLNVNGPPMTDEIAQAGNVGRRSQHVASLFRIASTPLPMTLQLFPPEPSSLPVQLFPSDDWNSSKKCHQWIDSNCGDNMHKSDVKGRLWHQAHGHITPSYFPNWAGQLKE
ncbi:hypothetical protein B0H13DRAFT_1867220 [Mycena leptocephala]|nr:hypothetical protein B0H13DRAFT_1867220 [Mycena leptocephala]